MIRSWRVRQVSILATIALILLGASTLRELAWTLRGTLDRAQVEGDLVARDLLRELVFLANQNPGAPLGEVVNHPRIYRSLGDAEIAAPSVLAVEIRGNDDTVIAHTVPARVGQPSVPMVALPEAPGFLAALRIAWTMWRDPTDYAIELPLVAQNDEPIAVIRVVSGSAFLLHDTQMALRRGAISIAALVLLSLGTGVFVARRVSRQVRRLEASIAALREGRPEDLPYEKGFDEFEQAIRELNQLGARIRGGRSVVDDPTDLFGEGIVAVGADDRIVLQNDAAWTHLGIEGRHDVPLPEIVDADHPLRRIVDEVRGSNDPAAALNVRGASGEIVLVAHRVEGGDSGDGVLVEVKPRRAHDELKGLVQHSRVLNRVGSMAAGVAHELRGPLQGLEFDLDALESSLDVSDEARGRLEDLQQKIQRLEWVVSGFLKVMGVRPVRTDAIPVAELLEAATGSLETEALLTGITFGPVAGDVDAVVFGDRESLRRAVENVLSNALEALPSRTGRVECTWRRGNEGVEISITDTGPGIEVDRLEDVFDLYFTTKEHGTGVGLALVRQAVDLHHGDVFIESELGVGTTVTLILPAAAAQRTRSS